MRELPHGSQTEVGGAQLTGHEVDVGAEGDVEGPRVRAVAVEQAAHEGAEPVLPVARIERGLPALDGGVEHEAVQLVLGGHVAVEGHGAELEGLGHALHGDRGEPLGVGDADRSLDDALERELALGASLGSGGEPPGERERTRYLGCGHRFLPSHHIR